MIENKLTFLGDEIFCLTEEEKQVMCLCISAFGNEYFPTADSATLRFFEKNYALGCIAVAYYSSEFLSEKGKETVESIVAKLVPKKGGTN